MDGELKTARELWARYLSDEGITNEEEAKLRETLLTNEEIRGHLLADDSMHRCLQALSIPLEDEDEFVSDVMSRFVDSQRSVNCVDPPQPPPIVEELDMTPAFKQTVSTVPMIRRERRRRRKNGWMRTRSVKPLAAVATLALFFAFGALIGIVFSNRSQVADRIPLHQSPEHSIRAATPRAIPTATEPAVATLVSADFGSWDRPRVEGSRLRPGHFRLERGEAEITLDSGALVRLIGPAEIQLDSPSQLAIHRGTLAAVVPRSAGEVRLRTPTSNVIGQIAKVELVVNQEGASDVLVHDGSVTVEPWHDSVHGKPLLLTSTDVNRATVWQPADTDPRSPLAMISQSDEGKFSGRISVNGRVMDFDSPEAFETVRQRVETQFRDSVEQLERDWATAVRRYGSGRATGEVSVNGVRMGFENLDDVIQLQRQLAEASARQASIGNTAGASSFQGMININGEVRKFSSAEEFEKAQQEVFGPLQPLDLGVIDERNLGGFFKSAPDPKPPADNPFLPRKSNPANEFNPPAKDNLRL